MARTKKKRPVSQNSSNTNQPSRSASVISGSYRAQPAPFQQPQQTSSSVSQHNHPSTSTHREQDRTDDDSLDNPVQVDQSEGMPEEGEFVSFVLDTEGDDLAGAETTGEGDAIGIGVDSADAATVMKDATGTTTAAARDEAGLLLPDHVHVTGTKGGLATDFMSDSDAGGASDSEEDDKEGGVAVVDARETDAGGPSRYYAPQQQSGAEGSDNVDRLKECPICGEKGHTKKTCPHTWCLSCGALDDHPSHQCPQTITCHRCGLAGHLARDCNLSHRQPRGLECEKCGSRNHAQTACPTWWRTYHYVADAEHFNARQVEYMRQKKVKAMREREKRLASRSDHEQYPAEVELDLEQDQDEPRSDDEDVVLETPDDHWDPATRWCYNCAMRGNHWGDDCPTQRVAVVRATGEWSAFSEMIAFSGKLAQKLPPPPPKAALGSTAAILDLDVNQHNFTFAIAPTQAGPNRSSQRAGLMDIDAAYRFVQRKERDRMQPSPPPLPGDLAGPSRRVRQSSPPNRYRGPDRDRIHANQGPNGQSSAQRFTREQRRRPIRQHSPPTDFLGLDNDTQVRQQNREWRRNGNEVVFDEEEWYESKNSRMPPVAFDNWSRPIIKREETEAAEGLGDRYGRQRPQHGNNASRAQSVASANTHQAPPAPPVHNTSVAEAVPTLPDLAASDGYSSLEEFDIVDPAAPRYGENDDSLDDIGGIELEEPRSRYDSDDSLERRRRGIAVGPLDGTLDSDEPRHVKSLAISVRAQKRRAQKKRRRENEMMARVQDEKQWAELKLKQQQEQQARREQEERDRALADSRRRHEQARRRELERQQPPRQHQDDQRGRYQRHYDEREDLIPVTNSYPASRPHGKGSRDHQRGNRRKDAAKSGNRYLSPPRVGGPMYRGGYE